MTAPDRAAILAEQVRLLTEQVGEHSVQTERLAARTKRTSRVTAVVVAGLVLDIVLSIAVGFAFLGVVQANQTIQAAIDREAQTRQQALCPVYGLVLGGYNPSTRTVGPDRDAYIQTFKVMNDAYDALDCSGALVPGPAR